LSNDGISILLILINSTILVIRYSLFVIRWSSSGTCTRKSLKTKIADSDNGQITVKTNSESACVY